MREVTKQTSNWRVEENGKSECRTVMARIEAEKTKSLTQSAWTNLPS